MKRIKREVEDFYGDAVAAPAAAAATATRGRSATRKPHIKTDAEKTEDEVIASRLKARGQSASAAAVARERSIMRREKLSPTSGALNADRVKYEGLYKKASDALKTGKIPEGKTKEQLEGEKAAAKIAYQSARDALAKRAKPKATSGGARRASRKSRSRRASRKQRKASRKSRRSRRSMRR